MIDKKMKKAIVVIVAAILVIVTIGILFYSPGQLHNPLEVISVQGNVSSSVVIPSGKTIAITPWDEGMRGGAMITFSTPIFHSVTYELNVEGYYIITGSWKSTGETLFFVVKNQTVFMEFPTPNKSSGILNQTLSPGIYAIIIGGWVGDVVSITSSVELRSYVPHKVGSFMIPSGTVIVGPKTYSIYLDQPASLSGSFTVGGSYWFSLENSSFSSSFGSYNSSSEPYLYSFDPFSPNSQPPLNPGFYNLSFAKGTFYINQTMEFVYIFDYSTEP